MLSPDSGDLVVEEVPKLIHLEILFKTDDPRGAELLKAINELGEFTIERFEAEWFLYSILAKKAALKAEQLRQSQVETKRRREAASKRNKK